MFKRLFIGKCDATKRKSVRTKFLKTKTLRAVRDAEGIKCSFKKKYEMNTYSLSVADVSPPRLLPSRHEAFRGHPETPRNVVSVINCSGVFVIYSKLISTIFHNVYVRYILI